MKKKYRILLFFPIFSAVFLGLEYLGQAMSLLPMRTSFELFLETALVGFVSAIFFVLSTSRKH